MPHNHLLRPLALGCALGAVCACESLDEPSSPSSAVLSESGQLGGQAFYYFRPSRNAQDVRIALEIDPSEIVVASASRDDALAAFAAQGLNVDSAQDISHAGRDHRRIRLAPGTSRDTVVAAGLALRDDPRISFVVTRTLRKAVGNSRWSTA